ncbi:MAG: ligase-associated DNA damage response endonuclease PdeM [Bacteroidetes bacterium]|nr:ligase-associated DNA damage response endonuclease PdeM [Bacteroidota bacterium]
MHPPLQHILLDQTLWLSANRTVFWEEEKSLILADLHFGKTGHFRKAGIGVPQTIYKEDLQCLIATIQFFKPVRLIVVGDMFHSKENTEHDLFEKWRNDLSSLEVHLVKGNHDILNEKWYKKAGIVLHDNQLIIKDFIFLHDYTQHRMKNFEKYSFCGHIHPGIRLSGIARQGLLLPCFHFESTTCTLPAFSKFTGTSNVKRKAGDKVFAIAEDKVFEV